jgi:hypothetical protein
MNVVKMSAHTVEVPRYQWHVTLTRRTGEGRNATFTSHSCVAKSSDELVRLLVGTSWDPDVVHCNYHRYKAQPVLAYALDTTLGTSCLCEGHVA